MGGVVVPQARQKDDLLTTVMKGMSIAKDVYGISAQADASERADAEEKRKTQDREFAAKGGITPLQKATLYGQGAEFTDNGPPGPGATQVYIGTPENNTPLWMTVRRAKAPQTVVQNANIDGKYGTATYDPETVSPTDPKAGLRGFVETKQKDPRADARPVAVITTDTAGNPVTRFVDPAAGMTLPRPAGGDGSAKADQSEEKIAYSQFDKLDKNLRVQDKSSRTAIGVAANKLQGADRLLGYVDVTPDEVGAAKSDPKAKAALVARMDQLSPQKKAEVVQALMAQLGTGVGSLSQFEHLNAATAGERIANLQQYFTQHPVGAESGGMIVDNLMSMKNERDISQKVIKKYYENVKNGSPVAFRHEKTKADAEKRFNDEVSSAADEVLANSGTLAAVPAGGAGTANAAPAGGKVLHQPGTEVRVRRGDKVVSGIVQADGVTVKISDQENTPAIPPQQAQ